MNAWLARTDARSTPWTVPVVTLVLLAAQSMIFVLGLTDNPWVQGLQLDPEAVRHGQWWRVIGFLAVPPTTHPVGIIVSQYLLFQFGSWLESRWGTFRFQCFVLFCAMWTAALCLYSHAYGTNGLLLMSFIVVLATMHPTRTIPIPLLHEVSLRWIGFVTVGLMFWLVRHPVDGGWNVFVLLGAFLNYLTFFGRPWLTSVRNRVRALSLRS